jgi:hypothetical protein
MVSSEPVLSTISAHGRGPGHQPIGRRLVYSAWKAALTVRSGVNTVTISAEAAMPAAVQKFKPSFFFWMTLAMCLFVFGGFGMHSFWPAIRGNFPPAPPVVHLHALLFVSWMLLLVAQSALVCTGNVKLHRSLGLWGVAHGTAVISMGLMMQLIASGAGYFAGRSPGTDGLYLGLLACSPSRSATATAHRCTDAWCSLPCFRSFLRA